MSQTVDRMIRLLEEIRDNTDDSVPHGSSIEIEDLSGKPDPKVTTKVYAGSPLTQADVDMVLEAHAYAKRRARQLADSQWQTNGLAQWEATVKALTAAAQAKADADLEELPDFEDGKP